METISTVKNTKTKFDLTVIRVEKIYKMFYFQFNIRQWKEQ